MLRTPESWGFTPGERHALLLLCAAGVLGLGYRAWQTQRVPLPAPLTAADSAALAAIRLAALPDSAAVASSTQPISIPGEGRIDLNAATSEQLQTLPGIGPILAGRIIAERQERRGFRHPAELLDVPGIGSGRFKTIEALVTCAAPEDTVVGGDTQSQRNQQNNLDP